MKSRFLSKLGKSLGSTFRSVLTVALAVVLTVGLFLLLPLIQAISASDTSDLEDDDGTEVVFDEPPPPPEEEEDEPEEPDEPPPPEPFDSGEQISFDDLNSLIDGPVGSAGIGGRDLESLLQSLGSGGDADDVFSVSDLDQVPVEKFTSKPNLPPALRRKSGATVVVVFTVDSQGRVLDARIGRSTDSAFNSATLDCIRKWSFEPGRREGQPVTTRNCRKTFSY